MSKESTSAGLLTKMARFVRHPSTSWSELDKLDSAPTPLAAGGMSKQALKEMVERKRRNDFVRRREFDTLRKLRRREVDGATAAAAAGGDGTPSLYPSDLAAQPPVKREQTLQKIDQVEQQVTRHWFKGKTTASAPLAAHPAATAPGAVGAAAALGGAGVAAGPIASPSDLAAFEPTRAFDAPHAGDMPLEMTGERGPVTEPAPLPDLPHPAVQLPLAPVPELVEDPEIEEVAILFANGESDAAESLLQAMLGPEGTRREHLDTWLALFDLYRATGQQERYENVAVEFAARFGRSAPQFFSLPDILREAGLIQASDAGAVSTAVAHWTASSNVTRQNLATLATVPTRFAPPWRIDWRYVKGFEAAALTPLTEQIEAWSNDRSVQLRFIGTDNLLQVLADATPSNEADVDPLLWRLRLAVLRVIDQGEEFDIVALNYCITYEVSPPAWEPPRCECLLTAPDGEVLAGGEVVDTTAPSSGFASITAAPSELQSSSALPVAVQLSLAGEVVGDAQSKLAALEHEQPSVPLIDVSCDRVLRVDFVAAGTLLNWVAAENEAGRQVRFTGVNRLVGAFFRMIGINDVAQIVLRAD